ncbi:MAG TPA: hypothetical protein VJ861_10430 [Treponemataceae bacterium]|nr:hypothetical protein [Treponemataceae bacterium]
MKKLVAALSLVLLVGSVNLFAFGIGVQGGYGIGGSGAAVTFKLDSLPYVFAVNASFGSEYTFVGGSADYWLRTGTLAGPVNYFAGVGLGVGIGLGDTMALNAALRVPIGINAYFLDNFIEPYLQIVPAVGLSVLPDVGLYFDVGANLGLRFWF